MLTQTRLREVLNYVPETGEFTWKVPKATWIKAGRIAGHINYQGYRFIMIDGRLYVAHRLAWLYQHGEFPKHETDHVNRVRSDNRICNLRVATKGQNMANKKCMRDGLKGAYYDKRASRWVSKIKKDKKHIWLGTHQTEEDAHAAYMAAAKQLHGEFARSQ